ncbi:hypothetical protein Fcan01_09522 [Folsomia candida]|uniref:Uncharacterized protein n=1 Tax=Folsomia candida TaxID=158441 RepID=A0A226EEM3_FOLCA|nr:hypothetical protein Fcan01_09522 [Folsomia candida]
MPHWFELRYYLASYLVVVDWEEKGSWFVMLGLPARSCVMIMQSDGGLVLVWLEELVLLLPWAKDGHSGGRIHHHEQYHVAVVPMHYYLLLLANNDEMMMTL